MSLRKSKENVSVENEASRTPSERDKVIMNKTEKETDEKVSIEN